MLVRTDFQLDIPMYFLKLELQRWSHLHQNSMKNRSTFSYSTVFRPFKLNKAVIDLQNETFFCLFLTQGTAEASTSCRRDAVPFCYRDLVTKFDANNDIKKAFGLANPLVDWQFHQQDVCRFEYYNPFKKMRFSYAHQRVGCRNL